MLLYLIRHGESEGNKLGKIQGRMDFPLSSRGKLQATKLAAHFTHKPLQYIYSSDLSRAYYTAEAIGKAKDIPVQKWEKLREIALGPFEGKTREEIDEEFPELKDKSLLTTGIEGTEQIEEITARCHTLLEQLEKKHDNDHVVLVSHGSFISIFIMYIMHGDDWHLYRRPFQINNTGVTLIEAAKGKKPFFHYINSRGHLDDLEDVSAMERTS